jgi:hypothetical protein
MRNNVAVSLWVNDDYVTSRLSAIEITQEDGLHEVAKIDVLYTVKQGLLAQVTTTSDLQDRWAEESRVRLEYGAHSLLSEFFGYVIGSAIIPTEQPVRQSSAATTYCVRYTCLGMSYPMQNQKYREWRNQSYSSIARAIAKEHGLHAAVDLATTQIPYRMQNGQSDFRFLADLADEIGYRFVVHQGVLYFRNVFDAFLDAQKGIVPSFYQNNTPGNRGPLREFRLTQGTTLPTGGRLTSQQAHVIANGTVVPVTATRSTGSGIAAKFTQVVADRAFTGYGQATARVVGAANTNAQWVTADLVVDGDSRVFPGSVVNIFGTSLPTGTSGLWMVRKAVHRIHMGANPTTTTYFCDLSVGRDDVDTLTHYPAALTSKTSQPVTVYSTNNQWFSVGAS